MKHTFVFLLMATALSAQALKPGMAAPPIVAQPLDAANQDRKRVVCSSDLHLKFMNETHFRFPADGDRPFGAGAQTGHGCAAHRGATTRRRQTVSGMGSVS